MDKHYSLLSRFIFFHLYCSYLSEPSSRTIEESLSIPTEAMKWDVLDLAVLKNPKCVVTALDWHYFTRALCTVS